MEKFTPEPEIVEHVEDDVEQPIVVEDVKQTPKKAGLMKTLAAMAAMAGGAGSAEAAPQKPEAKIDQKPDVENVEKTFGEVPVLDEYKLFVELKNNADKQVKMFQESLDQLDTKLKVGKSKTKSRGLGQLSVGIYENEKFAFDAQFSGQGTSNEIKLEFLKAVSEKLKELKVNHSKINPNKFTDELIIEASVPKLAKELGIVAEPMIDKDGKKAIKISLDGKELFSVPTEDDGDADSYAVLKTEKKGEVDVLVLKGKDEEGVTFKYIFQKGLNGKTVVLEEK